MFAPSNLRGWGGDGSAVGRSSAFYTNEGSMSDIREFPITSSAFLMRRLALEIALDRIQDRIDFGPITDEWLAAHTERETLRQRHSELMEAA